MSMPAIRATIGVSNGWIIFSPGLVYNLLLNEVMKICKEVFDVVLKKVMRENYGPY